MDLIVYLSFLSWKIKTSAKSVEILDEYTFWNDFSSVDAIPIYWKDNLLVFVWNEHIKVYHKPNIYYERWFSGKYSKIVWTILFVGFSFQRGELMS